MSALFQKYYRISVLFLSLLLLSRPSQAEEIVTEPIRTFEGHRDIIWSVAFSPDGQRALSGSADDVLKLRDLSFETTGTPSFVDETSNNTASVAFTGLKRLDLWVAIAVPESIGGVCFFAQAFP